ncbi:unnamed protein product, partial [Closterium sp. NIES-54]
MMDIANVLRMSIGERNEFRKSGRNGWDRWVRSPGGAKVSGSNPSVYTSGISVRGGCQRSTGDPRLILGKGYRLVVLGERSRVRIPVRSPGGSWAHSDPLLKKPFYPN